MNAELIIALPEITLVVLACMVLIIEAFNNDPQHTLTYWTAQASLLITLVLVFINCPGEATIVFNGGFISDAMSSILKAFMCGISFIVFLYSYEYLKEHQSLKGEYFVLGLFAVLGMMIMASAASLLSVYLGLELLSLSLYAMVAMQRDSESASEAAMKYFILGALASGMLLYGISMIYGLTGHLQLAEIAQAVASDSINRSFLVFGMIFLIIGMAFKLGAAPFHMWVPDVYQGAPTCVTLFISTAPKLAAFAMGIRLLVDGLLPLVSDWQSILMVLAVLSMGVGNVIAIAQTNIKRMLAYSTIAHVGFLFLGFIAGTEAGFSGSMFYIISYALMSMGAFGMIILLGRNGFEAEMLDDFKGLSERSPWFAFVMLCIMFSMAGVPPFLGFWSKWFVLKEVVSSGYVSLAAIAVVFSIIGAYYYLRIVKLMYFDKAESMTAIKSSKQMRMVLSVNGMAILLLGLAPNALMALCIAALAG
ncbi:MAG: NADH-quinone oxidoreductase subunit NuoN [Proteobacteria bacterium]|nr:NADH-quinone oxidoreductase subunit NuoN [Pseudomonadota bacterium]NOG59518.1 NADH-quinone oxidoreductase subunit NuoN [Pseudomonadota bacterium]